MESLPPELTCMIASFLTLDQLKSFSLISRAIGPLLKPRIFKRVSITETEDYLALFRLVYADPWTARCIQHMHLFPIFTPYDLQSAFKDDSESSLKISSDSESDSEDSSSEGGGPRERIPENENGEESEDPSSSENDTELDEDVISSDGTEYNTDPDDPFPYETAWREIHDTALKLGLPKTHPLREPTKVQQGMKTPQGTAGALLLLTLYALPSLKCLRTPEFGHRPTDSLVRSYLLAPRPGLHAIPFPNLPVCPGLNALKSMTLGPRELALETLLGFPDWEDEGIEYTDCIIYFFAFPGLQHLLIHSITEEDRLVSAPLRPPKHIPVGKSEIKHLTLANPALPGKETKFLLSLPRALETFQLRADNRVDMDEWMYLRDWRDALLPQRKTLRLLAIVPVDCPSFSNFVGRLQEQEDGEPGNDKLGSLEEFEALEVLAVSIAFLLGYASWREPRVKLRNILPRGLRRLSLCMDGYQTGPDGPEDEDVFEDVAVLDELKWMVKSGEWKNLEVVRLFGVLGEEHADAVAEECKEFGVKLEIFPDFQKMAGWREWEWVEEPINWEIMRIGRGLEQVCWPPNEEGYERGRGWFRKRIGDLEHQDEEQ